MDPSPLLPGLDRGSLRGLTLLYSEVVGGGWNAIFVILLKNVNDSANNSLLEFCICTIISCHYWECGGVCPSKCTANSGRCLNCKFDRPVPDLACDRSCTVVEFNLEIIAD